MTHQADITAENHQVDAASDTVAFHKGDQDIATTGRVTRKSFPSSEITPRMIHAGPYLTKSDYQTVTTDYYKRVDVEATKHSRGTADQ